MKRASAIVTERGGRTCHSAIISRELGIPCIVGTGNATEKVTNGTDITVSCAEGDRGNVYYGKIDFKVEQATDNRQRTAADEGDDERRRPRSRILPFRGCRTTASASHGLSSSSTTTSEFIRWRL